jgi:hypothetical protein
MSISLKVHSEKLRKLFLMLLSSTADGEVVAARNAMMRLVQSTGSDLHGLAQVLVDGLTPQTQIIFKERAPSAEMPARDIARWCLEQFENGGLCHGQHEKQFVCDMSMRWGDPTEKQRAWLAKIHARLLRNVNGT